MNKTTSNFRGSGGGKAEERHIRKDIVQFRDVAIRWAEVMAPAGYTVDLVNRNQDDVCTQI